MEAETGVMGRRCKSGIYGRCKIDWHEMIDGVESCGKCGSQGSIDAVRRVQCCQRRARPSTGTLYVQVAKRSLWKFIDGWHVPCLSSEVTCTGTI